VTRVGDTWHADDPNPPAGTILEKGGPGDKVSFMRGPNGWFYAYNKHQFQPCHDGLVRFWSPLKVIKAVRPNKKHRTN
jgi:hypothetical protein